MPHAFAAGENGCVVGTSTCLGHFPRRSAHRRPDRGGSFPAMPAPLARHGGAILTLCRRPAGRRNGQRAIRANRNSVCMVAKSRDPRSHRSRPVEPLSLAFRARPSPSPRISPSAKPSITRNRATPGRGALLSRASTARARPSGSDIRLYLTELAQTVDVFSSPRRRYPRRTIPWIP